MTLAGAPVPAEAASRDRRRTILFVVWPEPGHIAAPVALARRLRARGDRVVFAGAGCFEPRIRALGFDFASLSSAPGRQPRFSVFARLPGRAALGEAVDELVAAFGAAVERHRPSLVLFDTLYGAFAILAQAAGLPWAQYETDLPRELDPAVPPPDFMVAPDGPAARLVIRRAWARGLWRSSRLRHASRRLAPRALPFWGWQLTFFPDALLAELEARFGRRVAFNRATLYAPVARGPRLVFCPRAFDFPRTRADEHLVWVGPCLDLERSEPAFPWDAVPPGAALAYCSFGTQSLRSREAPALLRTIGEVFARRDDFFLVMACPESHRASLPATITQATGRVLVVTEAPQLALLRRARLAITHAGFNSVKECAAFGVPMIALPLLHDQPRNAALVQHHGAGLALYPPRLTAAVLDQAVTEVSSSPAIRESCRRLARLFAAAPSTDAALATLDDLLGRRGSRVVVGVGSVDDRGIAAFSVPSTTSHPRPGPPGRGSG